jgi:hypothetical protein
VEFIYTSFQLIPIDIGGLADGLHSGRKPERAAYDGCQAGSTPATPIRSVASAGHVLGERGGRATGRLIAVE